MYHTSLIIQEDFYTNPLEVRAFALAQDFSVVGNYPGSRTKSFADESIVNTIQDIVSPHAGKITWFGGDKDAAHNYTGSFQLTYAKDRTWIHNDSNTSWAAVLYLTPDAPVTGGTGLFRHKKTGWIKAPRTAEGLIDQALLDTSIAGYEYQDYTKWELHDQIGNKFNRLVMYRGDYFHASLDYFGETKENGRLFQTFFFNTEY